MSGSTRYSPELRERAVRMAIEHREDYKSEWATFVGVSKLFGMSPETLRSWVRKAQIDSGSRPGLSWHFGSEQGLTSTIERAGASKI